LGTPITTWSAVSTILVVVPSTLAQNDATGLGSAVSNVTPANRTTN